MAQLILTWSAPSECNGCTFEYRYKLSSASTYVTGATSNTIVTINNLIDAQTYNYSVRTVCPDDGGNLRSRWLNGSSVTCNTNPPLQPTPTPTITPTPTATSTPTPTPTPTATVVVPTATPTPTPTATVSSCITGTASATGNCSGSGLSTFTLLSGYQAVVKPSNSSFFYSGTGTRYAYAYLRTNTGTNIQEFTLTQVNSNSPTFSPTGYTITTPGTYQLYVQQVDCNQGGTGGSGTMTLNVGDCQVSTSPTATPTPTPTPTQAPGQCYTFTVSNTVNQDNYGVRYTDPNVGTSQDVKFNMLPAEDGGSYSIFYICSNVDPTLLDYTGGSPIGVGSISGVSKLGPNGECSSSLDCYPPTAQYCYYDNAQQTTVGPFSTLQECQNAAGSYVCNQCIS